MKIFTYKIFIDLTTTNINDLQDLNLLYAISDSTVVITSPRKNDSRLYSGTLIMASVPGFTLETAKAILTDVLTALNTPENLQKLAEAKESSGNEMLKMMQFVFPLVTQIQMDVIKNYGFPEGREGTVQFAQLIRALEREDSEIAQLHSQIRSYFLPPVTINSSTEASL